MTDPGSRPWPDSPIEHAVADSWAQVFGSAPPSREDDFLACGGHSLLAMHLAAAVGARTGRTVEVATVFECRTAGHLAARLATPSAGEAITTGHRPVLAAAQRRMWAVEQLVPGTPAHNIPFAIRLRGPLDVPALRAALNAVAERHDVLRWRISRGDGTPEVTVAQPAPVELPLVEPAALDALVRAPFDFDGGPLWRACLLRAGDRDHTLAVVAHHIIFDGWSLDVFCADLSAAYRGALTGSRPALEPLEVTFADYVAALTRRQSAVGDASLAWWTDHLAGVPPVIDLPADAPRPPSQTLRGASAEAVIPAGLVARLDACCAAAGVTRNAGLLAVYAILLGRLAGRDDLVVGVPFADRWHAAFEPLIGLLLHIMPVRLRVDDEAGFAGLARRAQAELTDASAHVHAPWERVIDAAGGPRDLSRNPLIQVMFNPHDFFEPRLDAPGLRADPVPVGQPGSLFDLTLHISTIGNQQVARAVYNPDLYRAERIDALLTSYLSLVGDLVGHPSRPVRLASMRPPASGLPDWSQPLPTWHGPGLIETVAAVAASHPDQPAACGDGLVLRYRDVAAISVQVASALTAAGVAITDVVAVLAARHPALPAVLLGVLRTGARWAVMDPSQPPGFLVRQAVALQPRAVIAFADAGQGGLMPGQPITLDAGLLVSRALASPAPDGTAPPDDVPPPGPASTARGYLSITSGTTGQARLIEAGEGPLCHFLAWYAQKFALGRSDRFALLSGLAHDPALRDLFAPLVVGAVLCVPEPDLVRDPVKLAAWLRSNQVTVAHLTPQLARMLALAVAGGAGPLPDLRLIALGGDQASTADVLGLCALAPAARVLNFYGTTETPQAQAYLEVTWQPDDPRSQHHRVPAGYGIDGAQLIVLDRAGRPAAVGEVGEVLIRSRHLAVGYTDKRLTDERFGQTPGSDQGDRFFRTGDLGRYLPDGSVMLAGRSDTQAKVRGFRVEAGEVGAILDEHPGVRQSHVIVTDIGGEHRLRAFAVPQVAGLTADEVRRHLLVRLPAYAVPAELMLLRELPLTPNGKVDEAALARMTWRPEVPAGREHELSGRTERLLASVWREVLGRPTVGATDNFFDVGGDSIAIIAVQLRLERLTGAAISVADLFRYPTIRSAARLIDGENDDALFDRAARRGAERRARTHRRART